MGVLLAAALAATMAQAAPVPTEQSGACELHVWPSDGLHSAYWGFAHAGTVDGAVTGRANYPQISPTSLDTADQADVLSGMDSRTLTGTITYSVIVHRQPLALVGAALQPTAYLADHPSCYAELIVQRTTFQQDAFSGSHLGALISMREFTPDGAIRRTFMTTVESRLDRLSARSSRPVPAADAELEMHQAFRHDLQEFGQAYSRPPRQRR